MCTAACRWPDETEVWLFTFHRNTPREGRLARLHSRVGIFTSTRAAICCLHVYIGIYVYHVSESLSKDIMKELIIKDTPEAFHLRRFYKTRQGARKLPTSGKLIRFILQHYTGSSFYIMRSYVNHCTERLTALIQRRINLRSVSLLCNKFRMYYYNF